MEPFTTLTSRVVLLPINDIDTDQIIPARFLKVTDKAGLGANLFTDWRYREDGSPNPEFVLNQSSAKGAQVLFAGRNFGCGSSREHAPWALMGYGFKAVIASSFGDIFFNNSLKNGFLPVKVDEETHQQIEELLAEFPNAEIKIDLETQTVHLPAGKTAAFPIDGFSKTCLLKGTDELGYLLGFSGQIAAYEQKLQV